MNPFDKQVSQMDPLPTSLQAGDLLYVVRNGNYYKLDDLSFLQPMQLVTRIITSAEFLNSGTTPIEILDGPGTGLYINPMFATLKNIGGAAAYSVLDQHGIYHENGTKALLEFGLSVTTDLGPYTEAASHLGQNEYVVNDKLVFKVDGANPTVGANEFELKVWYNII